MSISQHIQILILTFNFHEKTLELLFMKISILSCHHTYVRHIIRMMNNANHCFST